MKDKIIDEKVVVNIDTPEGRKFYENMKEELTPLEALKDLREVKGWNDDELNKRLDIIEAELKALEIIKENYGVDILKKAYKQIYAGDYCLLKEVLK